MLGVNPPRFFLYGLAALFSIFISAWTANHTSVINPDGICYLQSAMAMEQGLSVATHLCEQARWPFYSVLIFGVVKVTHFSYLNAAFLLNSFFSLLTVIFFIAIINVLTNKSRVVWLAALVILSAHEFNSLRNEIIRDHGFWAFYLMSLLFFVRYFHMPVTQHSQRYCAAILWSSALVVAGLFRIEGILFLLLLPFSIFFANGQKITTRLAGFLQLNTLAILGCLGLIIWLLLHPSQQLSRLTEVQFHLLHGVSRLVQAFQTSSQALAAHVLSVYSARDAGMILTGMLMSWYFISVIANVSFIYAGLIIYAWWKKIANFGSARLAIWAYILINVVITAAYLVEYMFLAKRYLIALSLTFMLWVPFALENLCAEWRTRKWPLILSGLLIAIFALSGIMSFGHSKKYIREAGDWLAFHAPVNAKIYSNDYQVLFYANHMGNLIFTQGKAFENLALITQKKWQQFDFLALRFKKKLSDAEQRILHEINLVPVEIFYNERGDQVRIFQIHPESKR